MAHSTIPTITCTSSNVVYTVLQADIDMPGVNIFYGPDTSLGAQQLQKFRYALFRSLAGSIFFESACINTPVLICHPSSDCVERNLRGTWAATSSRC